MASIGTAAEAVEPQAVAKQRDHAGEREQRAGDLPDREAVAGQIEVRERNRDDRQRGEEDRGQPAVEELFPPVDQAVVGGEEHEADPGDQGPLRLAARPARAEERHERNENRSGEEKTEGGDVERPEAAVADLDDEPRRAPDNAEQRVKRYAPAAFTS